MSEEELARALEAVLLVAVEPVSSRLIAELVEESAERVEAACVRLAASYLEENRGFLLAQVAGGWRFQTHPDLAAYVERFANRDVSHRLSTAALETLAIVAYRQPVSRAQIAALRGVNADGVVRLLEQRGYVVAVGRAEGPGQPVLYGTTDLFLERLGLDRLDQLPPVEDFLPGTDVVGQLEDELRGAAGSVRSPGTAAGAADDDAGGTGDAGDTDLDDTPLQGTLRAGTPDDDISDERAPLAGTPDDDSSLEGADPQRAIGDDTDADEDDADEDGADEDGADADGDDTDADDDNDSADAGGDGDTPR